MNPRMYSLLRIVIVVLSIMVVYRFFRWVGYKGAIAFSIGLILMAYLLLSKNFLLLWIVRWAKADDYIDQLKGDDDSIQMGNEQRETGATERDRKKEDRVAETYR